MKQMNIEVLIATYNGEKYIKQQLESICSQSRKPDGILVTDGGSIDLTLDLCYKYLKDSGIGFRILETREQLNVAENFSKGIKNINGDIVFFSDQDDIWDVDKISVIEQEFVNRKCDIAFSDAYVVNSDISQMYKKTLWDCIGFENNLRSCCFSSKNKILLHRILKGNFVTGMCMAVTREFALKCLPIPKGVLHDEWLAICGTLAGNICSVNKCLVKYRQHDHNVMGVNKNIKQRISESKYRYNRLVGRKDWIGELIRREKYRTGITDQYLYEYLLYLNARINGIRNFNILKLLNELSKYYLYELCPISVFNKDLLSMLIHRV